MKQYILKADSCGNPDRGQNPNQRHWGVEPLTFKGTIAEIKEAYRNWIGDGDMGGGNMLPTNGIYVNRKLKYRIAYNGRIREIDPHGDWKKERELKPDDKGVLQIVKEEA